MDSLSTSDIKLCLKQQCSSADSQTGGNNLPVQRLCSSWLPAGATVWGRESKLERGEEFFPAFSRQTFFFFFLASWRIWAGSLAAFKGAQRKRHSGDDTQCFPYLHANNEKKKQKTKKLQKHLDEWSRTLECCGQKCAALCIFHFIRHPSPLKGQTLAEMFIGLCGKQPRWHWRQLLLAAAAAKREKAKNPPFYFSFFLSWLWLRW